jgi:O-acetyl-ADP-ribose deacetylase (regulator of RNase III)
MTVLKPLGPGHGVNALRVSLCDRSPEVARVLAGYFRDLPSVEVLAGDLFDLDCDALVSPANSFADMSGGLDQQIDRFYAEAAQPAAVARIAERFHGELPVGVATILAMGTRRFPHLIVSPTMRVPSKVPGTLNAYLSMRAALIAIHEHNRVASSPIRSVAVPGLCTGVGGMPPEESGPQMRAGYEMIVLGAWRGIVHPVQAPFALGTRD